MSPRDRAELAWREIVKGELNAKEKSFLLGNARIDYVDPVGIIEKAIEDQIKELVQRDADRLFGSL